MELSSKELYLSQENRLARYAAVSSDLTKLSDEQLRSQVEKANVLSTGIGGTAALLEVDNNPIFVKMVRLTELERSAEHVMSTRNLFDLPPCCHYGIGSPGSGAWREVAAHTMTTNWVLAGQCESFPLMYHWRVLKSPEWREPISDELSDVPQLIEFWGSTKIGERVESLKESGYDVVLFCEYVPYNLHNWLNEQIDIGEHAVSTALALVDSELKSAVSFMNKNGLLHFDVHFKNILTDGHRLYISDFGLVTSSSFELSEAELTFVELNKNHDGYYVVTWLVNWLVVAFTGKLNRSERIEFIRRCAEGTETLEMLDSAAKIIMRYAPIAVVINDFYTDLMSNNRNTPFPVEEIERVCMEAGLQGFLDE
ncbi:serine/threonine-protein kinase [Paenibacillus sp. SC116]|uniref:serine/threonine-protein kinase n=1 Tax=Paenibacillus sp. SC116 TaxID=2968986 RepID=UPI00215B0A69|nr:serine/threonine-protein kinase [Paenibacillus sp. SC116]MCR8845647.1 serine/threonine-protein kinase [Paenibacillus sp. SC116]